MTYGPIIISHTTVKQCLCVWKVYLFSARTDPFSFLFKEKTDLFSLEEVKLPLGHTFTVGPCGDRPTHLPASSLKAFLSPGKVPVTTDIFNPFL